VADPSAVAAPAGGAAWALFTWARSASLSAIPFIGTVDAPEAAAWIEWSRASGVGPAPGAATSGQSDLLVIVGRLSQKLAPVLMRTHAAMAHPGLVLWLPMTATSGDDALPFTYASVVDVTDVVPVDVVVHGCPPADEALARGLVALRTRLQERGR
jgi:NADH-quinone oxidoreductase subunit B